MKIKDWNEFKINESFGISNELKKLIKNEGPIDWETINDSLWELEEIKDLEIKNNSYIEDENGDIINVELEEGVSYRWRFTILIDYYTGMQGSFDKHLQIQKKISTITRSVQEMVGRAEENVVLARNWFKVEQVDFRGYGEIRWRFDIQFVSKDPVDEKSLKSAYNEYQLRTKFTPEFKEGLKKLTELYKKDRINLVEFLDYDVSNPNWINVGFITDDEIFGIAEYNTSTKRFKINMAEVEGSKEWFFEQE